MANSQEFILPNGEIAFAVAPVDPVTGLPLAGMLFDPYGSVKAIDKGTSTVHAGESYEYVAALPSLAAAGVAWVLGVTGDIDTHLHRFFIDADAAPILVEFFEGVTTSADGTPQIAHNRNRILAAAKPALTSVYANPTVTDPGESLTPLKILGTQKSVSSSALDTEWILKRNTKYAFKITNQSNQAAEIVAGFNWVEQNAIY